jgi:hypothetical protein
MPESLVGEEVVGGIENYSGPEQTSYGGSKRRKRGKRNSRRRSQKKSKKYMKKMYRGGEGDEPTQSIDPPSDPPTDSPTEQNMLNGGRRRRKGKMQKGKTRKGKVSKWITHVKNFSKTNKMDFRDALKDARCKASYHKMK